MTVRKNFILFLLFASCCPLLSGCPVVAWLVTQFGPPQKVEALYKPPQDKTILVFVDDMMQGSKYASVKEDLTEALNTQLTQHEVTKNVIPYSQLVETAKAVQNFNDLSVGEIGQRLEADIVLYVIINRFSLKEDEEGPLWKGDLQATVRLVDIKEGRLWPKDRPEGYPMPAVETPATEHTSANYGQELTRILAETMADRIAKLFYDYKVPAKEYKKRQE